MIRGLLNTTALVAITLGFGASAHAQTAASSRLEEVIVTATKTGSSNLQDTPIAITAFTAATLERTGLTDVRDLAGATPGLAIAENTGLSQVYIRGIGSNNIYPGSDPSSTVHLDGVYLARPSSYFSNFLDVERIEVLRGPQGTLYGRNSVGGTINIISRKPDDTFRAKGQFTVGNYALYRAEGFVSGPLVEGKVAGSLSLMKSQRDGYQKNIAPTGNSRVDSEDVWSGRAQLRFTPSNRLDVTVRGDYMDADAVPGGYLKTLVPGPDPLSNRILGDYRTVANDLRQSTTNKEKGIAVDGAYELTDALTLTSLTSYREGDFGFVLDSDAGATAIRRTVLVQNQDQLSQEFNLRGTFDGFSFVAGAYYFKEDIDSDLRVTNFVPNLTINPNVTVRTRALAGYAQGTYDFTDKISVTAGARYTEEKKKFGQNYAQRNATTFIPNPTYPRVSAPEGTYSAWTPKLEIDFRPVDGILLYASATRGFKSGGFNITSANPAPGFQPEFLWSYEAGFKGDLLERRLRVNAAAFHYNYSDLQVNAFITPGVGDITNAATATVDGVELEVTAKPADGFDIGATVAYLDAKYDRYPGAPVGTATVDASGKALNSAPKWSGNAYAQYQFDLGEGSLFLRGEYSYKSRQYFTPDNNAVQTQKAYGLFDASVGFTAPGGNIQVIAFGRNLADEEYVTTTASFTGPISGRVGEPRTFGARLIVQY